MLVISQKVGESFRIGEQITVRVLDIQGGRIRLGIEAPKDISVVRSHEKTTEISKSKKDLDFTKEKSDTSSH